MRSSITLFLIFVSSVNCQFDAQTAPSSVSEDDIFSDQNVRGYAYMAALMMMIAFAILVYFHVQGVRKDREMDQRSYQRQYNEWSPLIARGKLSRSPPPAYHQTI